MAFHSPYYIAEFFGIIIAVIGWYYYRMTYDSFDYWKSKKVTFVKPSFPWGNFASVLYGKSSIGEFFRDKYLEFKKSPILGVYTLGSPTLIINDPDLIRIVLTKEFTSFHDRGMNVDIEVDPLLGHLFLLHGAKWRFLRNKFSPTFTSSKMKQMFFTVRDCGAVLSRYVTDVAKKCGVIETKDLIARFSTDVIASTAFGIQCNSIENPDEEFRVWGRKHIQGKPLVRTIAGMSPRLTKLLNLHIVDEGVSNFFIGLFRQTLDYRVANKVVRKDFLHSVMELMDKGYVKTQETVDAPKVSAEEESKKITFLEGAAQAFVFWTAGFETSSTTVTNCLYELCLIQDIQDKVADEINTVLAEFDGVTYESIKEMTYLDKVVSETLRKYPPIPILNRQCNQEIELPGTGFKIPVGMPIIIPVLGLHWDPDLYPEPEKFDPERFNESNVAPRHPYTYLPFGEGPRNCIGMRFGLVQTKIALISLLSKYRFRPGPDLKVPMVTNKRSFVLAAAGGITLRIEQR